MLGHAPAYDDLVGRYGPRYKWLALFAVGLGIVLAPAVAPTLGGLLLGRFGWPAVFLINLPFCLLAFGLFVWHGRRAKAPIVHGFIASYILLKILDVTIGLRISEESERQGPGVALHGESVEYPAPPNPGSGAAAAMTAMTIVILPSWPFFYIVGRSLSP